MKLTNGLVTMNRERQVAEAIQSCLQSNLPNETEFVVINNASTDNTETMVKSILDSSGYPYVYYKTESNIGAGGGRTLYFEKSTGEYIYGMDDDAVVDFENDPDFFVKAIEILDGHQNIATLATQIYDTAWQANRQAICGKEIYLGVYKCKMFCGGSHFLRKSFFDTSPYLSNMYGYEELPPSLMTMDAGMINAFCPDLIAIHKPAVNKWDRSPIWGYGFDSFKYYNRLMTGHFYYSHNNYIELLYDLGIIGFAIYYWFYWKLFYVAWKGKNSCTPEIRAFVIGIVFSMLGGYVFGVGSTIVSFVVLGNYSLGLQVSEKTDFISQYVADGDLYGLILNIIDTMPMANVILVITVLCMIAFYATSFDSIAYTAACYSYKELGENEHPHKLIELLWCLLLIVLPIALVFSESSMNNIQSISIISAFPIGIIMIVMIISFFKDLKSYIIEKDKSR